MLNGHEIDLCDVSLCEEGNIPVTEVENAVKTVKNGTRSKLILKPPLIGFHTQLSCCSA